MLSYEKLRKEHTTLNLKRESYKFHQEVHERGFLTFALFEKNVLSPTF